MKKEDFNLVLQRYLDGTASESEQDWVEEWFKNIQTGDANNFSQNELTQIQKAIWNNVKKQLEPSKLGREFQWARIAASLLFILACSALFRMPGLNNNKTFASLNQDELKEFVSHKNADKTDHSICLPDGSSVVVRPDGEIKYPLTFGTERHVYLKGKAFFDVIRDPEHPFVVHTKDITTRVLGTSFWVQENPSAKTVEVSVKSGKVMVYAPENRKSKFPESLILKPNQKGVYSEQEETLVKKFVEEPIVVDKSIQLQLKYENTPVPEIFDKLQKIYGIQVSYNSGDLTNCSLTTELMDENLFERIQIICDALGLKYNIGKEAIEISGKCK